MRRNIEERKEEKDRRRTMNISEKRRGEEV